MTDGTFAKMSGSTLVGQWDKLNSNSYYEKIVNFTIKSQDQVDSSVLFRKVVNDADNGFDSNFTNFLSSTTVWKSFLDYDVNSVDPQVNGNPSVSVKIYKQNEANTYYFGDKPMHKLNKDTSNTLVLQFYQNLRKINSDGTISSNDQKQVLTEPATWPLIFAAP